MTTPTPSITPGRRSDGEPSATSTPSPAAAEEASPRRSGGVPVMTAVLFLAGCALLVAAAANLMNLGDWSQCWGVIPVFLVFFLVISIAGRWFWAGADAILGALMRGNRK